MRYFFVCCLLLLQVIARAQVLYPYKDTTYHYMIGLPEKWMHWTKTNTPNLSMIAKDVSHLKDAGEAVVPDNINVAVISQPGIEVDRALTYLTTGTAQSRLRMLDTGSYMVNGKKMLWFDDIHIGGPQNDTLSSSDFVVCSNGKAYVITCTTTAARFSEVRKLFHLIAQTFKTDLPAKQELIQIAFPHDTKWKTLQERDDSTMHFKQLVPVSETVDYQTTVISISEKKSYDKPLASMLTLYTTALEQSCGHPVYSLLSQSETSALFKIECDEKNVESSLCYLVRGATRWHLLTLAIHQGTMPADVTLQWSEIFRQSKIVME